MVIEKSQESKVESSKILPLVGWLLLLTFNFQLSTLPTLAQGEFKARKIVSSTALELEAGGTNQNITLTPSGTGVTIIKSNLGLNTTTPEFAIDLYPLAGSDFGVAASRAFSNTAGSAGAFLLYRARGTVAEPTAVASGDNLGSFGARGRTDTGWPTALSPRFGFWATEAWTSTANGNKIIFSTTPNGSITRADQLTIDQDGAIIATRRFVSGVNTVTYSATPTFDASLGNTQKITLTGNVTSSTLSNATAGQSINFLICQDATGSRTFVWPTNVLGGMTIGATLSTCSAQNFIFDGTNAYALSAGMTNM